MRITPLRPDFGSSVPERSVAAPAATPAPAGSRISPQAALLAGARQQLAQQPALDLASIDRLREALARGELDFDPARLAAIIQRHHGGGA